MKYFSSFPRFQTISDDVLETLRRARVSQVCLERVSIFCVENGGDGRSERKMTYGANGLILL